MDEPKKICIEKMIDLGFTLQFAIDTSEKNNAYEMKKAIEHFIKQKEKNTLKNKKINNECGYFLNILKGKYWENTKD